MFKKTLLVFSLLALIGCGTSNNSMNSGQPKYKISDEDTKRWIVEGNKAEQCLFPNAYQAKDFSSLSKEEDYLYRIFVWKKPLLNIIGTKATQIIFSDKASAEYADVQANKFNHSDKVEFNKEWCLALKKEYDFVLKQVSCGCKKAKKQ